MNAFRSHLVLVILLGLSVSVLALPGQASKPACTASDLDPEACRAFEAGRNKPVEIEDVAAALGLGQPRRSTWSAGSARETTTFHYRIAFRRAVQLGAIFVPEGQELRILRQDADYPGDPAAAKAWVKIEAPPRQGGGQLCTLPPGTATRALLFTDRRAQGRSELHGVRLFGDRLHNVTPAALTYAAEEFTPPNTNFIPNPASNIATGNGPWINVGKNDKGFVARPAISDIDPTWFLLTWKRDQKLTGIILNSNVEKYHLEVFTGPADVNPRAGTLGEWRRLKDVKDDVVAVGPRHTLRWLGFTPVVTRGLRLNVTKTEEGPLAVLHGLHALTDLGVLPVPVSESVSEQPPLKFACTLPGPGQVTLGVFAPDGRRLRNLLVRSQQTAGRHTLAWDLKDAAGNFVSPGVYRWSAITHPVLQLKYEMTVYPNVSRHAPGNSPWLNALHESGGWLADHTPPVSVCTAGAHAYIGAYVAESGVSLLECDLEGRKTWGHHSFAAWTGPRFLASDGKEVFVGANILGTSNESVWGVDIASKKVRTVLSLTPTATRPRGLQGIAAHDGKLYLSIRGEQSYLTNAASADDADIDRCIPLLPTKRLPRVAYEVVPDHRGDFVRLFRLTGTPPGGATQETNPWLATQSGPSPRHHLVLAFKRPVPLGSLAFPWPEEKDVRLTVSILKAGAPYPPDPDKETQWVPLTTATAVRQPSAARTSWDVIPAPEGTQTRALRLTFARGAAADSDPLANLLDGSKTKDDPLDPDKKPRPRDALEFGPNRGVWRGRLEGMRLLRRRFANVAGTATVRVSSGKVAADGAWDAMRKRPVTEDDPGVYALEWQSPQALRGLAIKEIDGELTKIDVFTGAGAPGASATGAGMAGWQTVAEYRQERRDHHTGFERANPTARYVDGTVDFGKVIQTRAVRLRVVKQWSDNAPDSAGVRADLGGTTLDPARCRIWGVAALHYLGSEPAVDSAAFERVEVYDIPSGKQLGETPVIKPGTIAVNSTVSPRHGNPGRGAGGEGQLFAVSENRIVRIGDTGAGGSTVPVVTDLKAAGALAFDTNGNLYVFDNAPERKQVRVYDPAGKFLRAIGKAGGLQAGPWDPERLGDVTGIAVDRTDQLWVVDGQYHPKRVTVWTTAGGFKKELLGNTPYGGGGVLDPEDKTRLFYGPLEFELDWQTGLSRIKNLTWTGATPAGEVPLRVQGRTYLVTRPQFADQLCAIVYLYNRGKLKLAAAMGWADQFEPLKALHVQLGSKPLTKSTFLWSDRNGDGVVQADEVTLIEGSRDRPTHFNSDLGIQAGAFRYIVKEFHPDGVPVYERVTMPQVKGTLFRLDDGSFYRLGYNAEPEAVLAPDSQPRWTYPQEGPGVQSAQTARPYRPDQVVSQFGIVGHETCGELGEFVVIHNNVGAWNVWTRDGHLVGPIFRDRRVAPARPWSMKEHARGLILQDITCGEEHFSGYLCRSRQDNKVYVVAGHNHISILELLGLDKVKRLSGEITVTAADLKSAQQWDARQEKTKVFARAPVLNCYRMPKPPAFDGSLSGWGPGDAVLEDTGLAQPRPQATLHLGYDDKYLFLAFRVRNLGPLQNSGTQWDRLFKTGAAVDVQIGTDPTAPGDRQAPVRGDLRLLLTFVDRKPMAVLYRPVAPGAPPELAWHVKSPVAELTFDEVKQLPGVRMVRGGNATEYVLQAAVPLTDIGWKPTPGQRLKFDWGVLVSGPDGTEVLRRLCWANRATQITADAPSEARLAPHLWGHVLIHGNRPTTGDRLSEIQFPDGKRPGKDVKKDVTDILDELKDQKK